MLWVKRTAVQVARVPLLLGLLVLVGRPHHDYVAGARGGSLSEAWVPWGLTIVAASAFVGLALAGRGVVHRRWVLAAEAAIALPLALVPTPQWAAWLGGTSGVLMEVAQTGFLQPLALAWLGAITVGAIRIRATRAEPAATPVRLE